MFGSDVFFMSFVWFFNVIGFSKICKTESFSIVIVGGQIVDISFSFQIFMECTHSSQHRFQNNFFNMFRRNTEFLGCRRLDLAYGNLYNWDNWIAVLFLQTWCFVKMVENHELPRLDLAYDNKMYLWFSINTR